MLCTRRTYSTSVLEYVPVYVPFFLVLEYDLGTYYHMFHAHGHCNEKNCSLSGFPGAAPATRCGSSCYVDFFLSVGTSRGRISTPAPSLASAAFTLDDANVTAKTPGSRRTHVHRSRTPSHTRRRPSIETDARVDPGPTAMFNTHLSEPHRGLHGTARPAQLPCDVSQRTCQSHQLVPLCLQYVFGNQRDQSASSMRIRSCISA
jgi:hypothetical protein